MKVMLVNGSPHEHGCTDAALREVASALNADGIDTEFFWIGNTPIGGCIACGGCSKAGKCVFGGSVNDFAEKAKDADGFVFGTPVHYAAASGNMTAFMDRLFYSAPKEAFCLQAARRHYLRPPAQAPRPRTSSCSNTPASRKCPSFPPAIGTMSTAPGPKTSSRTRRACASCAFWGTIWPGSCAVSRQARPQAFRNPARSRLQKRILSGKNCTN